MNSAEIHQKATTYIEANGDAIELARLSAINGQPVGVQVLAQLAADQRPDGGFAPFWAEEYSSIDATCYRLAQVEQLGIDSSAAFAEKAIQFLLRRQDSNASWQEAERVAEQAPPWAKPHQTDANLYLTANAAFWVSLWGERRSAERALSFLQQYISNKTSMPSFLHTHWLTAGLAINIGRTPIAVRLLGWLHGRMADFSASNLTWMMATLLAANLEPEVELLQRAGDYLLPLQNPDGSWTADDGDWQQVNVTLEALRVLRGIGRI